MAQVYGGDEVNAIVLDPGSSWTRVGWAGDDGPKQTIMSAFADVHDGPRPGRRYGDEQIHLVRPNTDIGSPLHNSVVANWSEAADLWKYALEAVAPTPEPSTDYLADKPLLVTEALWNSDENRRKTLSWALEDVGARAMYIMKSPVCALFGAGRGSGLVVDIGHDIVSVTPVIDGLVLKKPARRSRKAGAYLSSRVAELLASKIANGSADASQGSESHTSKSPMVAWYQIKSKEAVAVGEPPKWQARSLPDGITQSWHDTQVARVYDQFKESMVEVGEVPPSDQSNSAPRQFSLPNGQTLEFAADRFKLGETLFESPENTSNSDDAMEGVHEEWSSKGVADLVEETVKACDVDARATLVNNIVVTGGTSLVQGFTERLNQEVSRAFPMLKVRLYASGNIIERRNGAWIGGSITASLGTFHQLWVSREEYDEIGADQLVQKRFR